MARPSRILCASVLVSAVLLTGCTINRVGYVIHEPKSPVSIGEVKVAPKLTHGRRPDGMLWLKIMPILRSTPETRSALAVKSAAQLGCDTVSSLLSIEDVYAKWPLGIALISRSAASVLPDRPKFTIGMPLPTSPGGKMSAAAAQYLRQEIQYVAAEKGYFVYFLDTPELNPAGMQDGQFELSSLASPIGAPPDFILFAELTKVRRSGTEMLMASQDLEFNLILIDVDSRKPVWTTSTKGGITEGLLFPGIGASLVSSHDEDLREATRNTTLQALKTLPVIPQHQQLK